MSRFSFILNQAGLQRAQPQYILSEEVQQEKSVGISKLGTPVFSNLHIEAGSYNNREGKTINYEGLITKEGTAIDAVLFQVSRRKRIITTSLQGIDSTVKEFISNNDFDVKISGGVFGRVYPDEEVKKLLAICEAPVAIEVNSWFLRQFGIYNLVIDNYNFPQRKGFSNVQYFELDCLSDRPIELRIDEEG